MPRPLAAFALCAVALLLVALAGVAWAGPQARLANSITFPDSTGEDPQAPDIANVVVSNNDAGLVTFRINVPNRPTFSTDMVIVVYIDADANQATGDPDLLGAEYLIVLQPSASGGSEVGMARWGGADYVDTPQLSLVSSFANGATISVNANELGGTKKLSFGTQAISGIVLDSQGNPDTTNSHRDFAPDSGRGFYSYEVKTTPLALSVKSFGRVPISAKAGRPLTVFLVATRTDTGATIRSGTVTCRATLAGAPVTARVHAVVRGRATCGYRLPKTAKGNTIRGTITLQFEGLTAKRNFSARIG
jgi:hypothetical protein